MKTKAASISVNEIAAVAAQGVQRALEARHIVSEEISAEQAAQVGGAGGFAGLVIAQPQLSFERWLIYGGPWLRDLYGLGGDVVTPGIETVGGAKTFGV